MVTAIQRPGKNGKMYSNVKGVAPVPSVIKSAGLPPAINPNQVFRIAEPDYELFETFGKGLKAMIEESPEWQALQGRKAALKPDKALSSGFDDMEDDLPF